MAGRVILVSMTSRAPDLSGSALDGRYELHALIGEGAFGRVYRGLDRRLAHTFDSGPGLYRRVISGGHDSARWSMTVENYD